MFRTLAILTLFIFCHMEYAQPGFAVSPLPSDSKIPGAAELLKAPHPLGYGQLVREIFDGASTDKIDWLESSSSDGLAIQAAWERIRRTMKGPNYITKPITAKEIDLQSMQRFLGFVAGRLQAPIPKWWTAQFERQHYLYPGYLVTTCNDEPLSAKGRRRMKEFGNYLIPHEFTGFRNSREAFELEREQNIFRIPKQAIEKPNDSVAVVVNLTPIDKESFAVSSHPEVRAPYSLYSIDRKSQRVLWKSDVFCENIITPGETGTGLDHHWSEMARDNSGRLLVFGACDQSMYAEGFDVKSGKPVFRFSTSY